MGKTRVSVRAKLYNLGLTLKDATAVQNGVAAASAASSPKPDVESTPAPIVESAPAATAVVGVVAVLKTIEPLPSVEEKLQALPTENICTELNIERYDLRKDGTIGFSHPSGTHDDVYWSIALAIYATVELSPEPFLA